MPNARARPVLQRLHLRQQRLPELRDGQPARISHAAWLFVQSAQTSQSEKARFKIAPPLAQIAQTLSRHEHFVKLALFAVAATAIYGCAHAGDNGVAPNNAAPSAVADAATPDAPGFDEGVVVPQAVEKTAPTYLRQMLPRGAKSVFCLKTKLGEKDVLIHGWNPAKGSGHIDILVPVKTKATRKSRSRLIYQRLGGVRVGRIDSDNVAIRLTPLKAGQPGWVMSLNWSQSQSAGAFMTVPMTVFISPKSDDGKVLTQDTSTESSAGGNEYYDLRTDKNGDAFLMVVLEGFDAQAKNLQPYRWNGSQFVRQGESADRPLKSNPS